MATIRKRGERQWEARVRRRGYPVTCKTFETKAEAEGWASIIESEMVRGGYVSRREAEATTLKEALERYEREEIPKKKGHQEKYVVKAWIKHDLALRPLASIRSSDLAKYMDVRLKEVGPKTVHHHLGTLSNLFEIARVKWGMEGLANPVNLLKKPRLPNGRDRRMNDDERKKLIEACAELEYGRLVPIIELAVETAMRRGEIIKLTWEHIDLEKQTAHLPETKNGRPRTVPLSTRAVAILKGLWPREEDEPVKEAAGRVFNMHPDFVSRAFREVCAKAGLKNLRLHDVRHEATSRLFEKGLNSMEVASITGHETLQMLRRYTHLRAEDLAKKLG